MHQLISNPLVQHVAKEAVGAEETPCGGWSVTRLRSAAHGTANIIGLSLGIGPKGGLGEQGDFVYRQLILTKASLVERRPENYEVNILYCFISTGPLMQWFNILTLLCTRFCKYR